jgi:phosphate:Na+ symporter
MGDTMIFGITIQDLIFKLFTMLGGLAFFLYGMNVMSTGLEKLAGGKMEAALKKMTANPFMALILGTVITIAIQSSSAMTVMLVGLVNSGIMQFEQTIGVILGSNVGTTLTSWLMNLMGLNTDKFTLISLLSPDYLSPLMAFIGILLRMFAKKSKKQELGTMFLGFAVLMYGMAFMSDSVGALKTMDNFEDFIGIFSNPLLALLVSIVFTGVIQSSAATVLIVQSLAVTGQITYDMAIPLVLGANIGTCITALISSVGANKNAKRVVATHIYVNTIGTVVCMIIMLVVSPFISDYLNMAVNSVAVSIIHTLFNVFCTIVLFPLKNVLIKLVMLTVRDKEGEIQKNVFLDERLLNTPQMAIEECRQLSSEMANFTRDAVYKAISLLDKYDEAVVDEIVELEAMTDRYEDKLGTFLVRLSGRDLSEHDSKVVGRLLHTIGDFERIGDHCSNIADVAKEIFDREIKFSSYAKDEIKIITNAICLKSAEI